MTANLKVFERHFYFCKHALQSLACATAINTAFSELFSLKRIYVKYIAAYILLLSHMKRLGI